MLKFFDNDVHITIILFQFLKNVKKKGNGHQNLCYNNINL